MKEKEKNTGWIVGKFGGDANSNPENCNLTSEAIIYYPNQKFIVISAPGKRYKSDEKITEILIKISDLILKGKDWEDEWRKIEERFKYLIDNLLLHSLSDIAEEKFANLPKDELQKMQENFILVSGGVVVPKNNYKKKDYLTKEKKLHTTEVTLNLWKEGKDVYQIADERALSAKTIWGHIEELIEDGKIVYPDMNRLITKEIKKSMPEISKAFKKLDTDKLSPVFEHFDGKYSYDDIRVVRMLMNIN